MPNNYQPQLEKLYPENSIGGQCGVFVHKLIQIPLVGDTIQSKTAAVKKFGYTAAQVNGGYDAGDALILDIGTAAGHVCFVNNIVNGVMTLTESNWNLDQRVHHTRPLSVHDKVIVGCLRGKLLFNPVFNQRVLVLTSNIADLPNLQAGIKTYTDLVLATTTDFTIQVDYVAVTQDWTIVTDSNGTVYIQPMDIIKAAETVQLANGKQYDAVCLVYDNSKMNPKPNHPCQAPIFQDGMTVFEIPLDWISNNGVIDQFSTEIFFAHELSHSEYYLINTKGGFLIRDRTHDEVVLNPQTPTVITYFIQYLIDLEPFWSYLIH
jgi:hypothetical protein